ncbi:hypothetical protein [Pelomonas sp. SE-A7]|uniref:hypothetical protein n=1 Tax=Pelomonas sp. SE-A7 TaxID=3054953 RepID=UPI00259D3093|nr:hypothetical protein [Pelomonas sp. SE-A7]MDM4766978.1 hypothetical protein [Pelomonas sp. SE-A7]
MKLLARACWIRLGKLAAPALLALLSACSSTKYTVDDGRQVDPVLLGSISAYGSGERAIRPAIQRSSALKDKDCDKQWELPFAVVSSQGWDENDRVAWVRALGVDERLTVIATAPGSPLSPGEKLISVAGSSSTEAEQQLLALTEARDRGRAFAVQTAAGRGVVIQPFEVCRGYTRFAPPNTPRMQDYHWLLSMHPLEVPLANMNEDEALWLVLWSQGVSEEGGARMKTVHYSTKIASTLYSIFTIATGLKGAALAADAAISAAKNAAASAVGEVLKQQLIDQGKALALQKIRESFSDQLEQMTKGQVLGALQKAAANRGALSGISYVASTVFEKADEWAFTRVAQLNGNPLSAFSLHQKLLERDLTGNSMILDAERLSALNKVAAAKGFETEVVAILKGIKPAELVADVGAMPVASARKRFSYTLDNDPGANPYANGLIDATLSMPLATKKGK